MYSEGVQPRRGGKNPTVSRKAAHLRMQLYAKYIYPAIFPPLI